MARPQLRAGARWASLADCTRLISPTYVRQAAMQVKDLDAKRVRGDGLTARQHKDAMDKLARMAGAGK